jgi:sulfonate transport system substrate-binding protein
MEHPRPASSPLVGVLSGGIWPKVLWLTPLFALLLLIPTGCSQPESAADLHVRIGTFSRAIDYAPFIVAKEKGWIGRALIDKGATVTFTTFEDLPAINESIAAGQLDVIFEAAPPAIVGKAGGHDIRIVEMGCSLTQEIIARNETSIRHVRDLSGKTVAVRYGTSSHYGLMKALRDNGVDPSTVDDLDMSPDDARTAFAAGQIDAWACWPPHLEQQLVLGTGRVIEGSHASIHSIVAVRRGFADEHPDILAEVLKAVRRAKIWLAENPQEGQALVASELELELPVVELAWPKHDWSSTLTDTVVADIQQKADFLYDIGKVRRRVDAGELVQPM